VVPGFVYYVGRFLQRLAMSLLLMAIMTAGPLGPNTSHGLNAGSAWRALAASVIEDGSWTRIAYVPLRDAGLT